MNRELPAWRRYLWPILGMCSAPGGAGHDHIGAFLIQRCRQRRRVEAASALRESEEKARASISRGARSGGAAHLRA